MKNSRQNTPTSHATRMAAFCLKLVSLITGWGSVILAIYSRFHYRKNLFDFFYWPDLEEYSKNTELRYSWIIFGTSVILALVPIALFLAGKIDRGSLMKPYALSIFIMLPVGFLFFFSIFIPGVIQLFDFFTYLIFSFV